MRQAWDHLLGCCNFCTWTHLQFLHLDTPLLQQQNTKKLYGTKNNCVHAQFSSVHSVVSDSLWPHELQHTSPPCPSPTPGVYPNPCPLSRCCHPAISSSVIPFSSCPQSLPASGSFPMNQLFAWGGHSIGVSASASVLPMNTQDWSPLGWTGWISLQSKGLSRVFYNTTVGANTDPKDTKRPKIPTATFEEPSAKTRCWEHKQGVKSKNRASRAKAGCWKQKQGTAHAPLHIMPPNGWAKHLSHPSSLTPRHNPTLIPCKEQACPQLREWGSKGNYCLFSLLPGAAGAPVKPCLNFLSGLWSVSIVCEMPRTMWPIESSENDVSFLKLHFKRPCSFSLGLMEILSLEPSASYIKIWIP